VRSPKKINFIREVIRTKKCNEKLFNESSKNLTSASPLLPHLIKMNGSLFIPF